MDAFLKKTGAASHAPVRHHAAPSSSRSTAAKKTTPASSFAGSKKRPLEQVYLDFGQRTFGRTIECKECGFHYVEGEPTDEAAHKVHHRRAMQGVMVRGALAERRVLLERAGGERIIALHSDDGADAVRKVAETKALMDAELGGTPDLAPGGWRAVLLIEARTGRVRGCAIAEALQTAYCVVPPQSAASAESTQRPALPEAGATSDAAEKTAEAVQQDEARDEGVLHHDGIGRCAMVGISHIWVDASRRGEGNARALLDATRAHFASGFTIPRDKLAFSQPTKDGRRLAARYSGTEAFLVYE